MPLHYYLWLSFALFLIGTGGVLLAGVALGVYTIALVYRRAPTPR